MCRCFSLVANGQPLADTRRELAEPTGTEVLVRIRAAGVCHSDLMLMDGYIDSGTGRKLDMSRALALPRVLGHEIAGEVVALGPQATGAAVGDRVVVFPWIGCGTCSVCQRGEENLCSAPRALGVNADGGFSDHVWVPHPRYLVPMGNLTPEQAAPYACSGLTAFGALKKLAPFASGDSLLIIGAGGVGLSGVRLAKTVLGVQPIVAEIDRSKWALAKEAGAAEVIDPSEPDALKALMKATRGGVMGAIDFVGAGESFAFGFGALAKGGKLVCVGLFGGATPITPALVAMKAASVVGSYVGTAAELRELLTIAQSGVLPPLPVVTMPLDAANDAMEQLRAGKVFGRTVLLP
jgi:alcohol dehydrogenase/propanol-preferring alcohol dehydrogenase